MTQVTCAFSTPLFETESSRQVSLQLSAQQQLSTACPQHELIAHGSPLTGATLTSKEKLDIARQLSKLGVDIIEAGFPVASPDDFEAVRSIALDVGNAVDGDGYVPVICGLSRYQFACFHVRNAYTSCAQHTCRGCLLLLHNKLFTTCCAMCCDMSENLSIQAYHFQGAAGLHSACRYLQASTTSSTCTHLPSAVRLSLFAGQNRKIWTQPGMRFATPRGLGYMSSLQRRQSTCNTSSRCLRTR